MKSRKKEISVQSAVEKLLDSARKKLTAGEVAELTQLFLEAGSHAIRSRLGTAQQAAQALDFGRGLSQASRLQLARKTLRHPVKPFLSSNWQPLSRALSEHLDDLAQRPGVLGVGLSHRYKAGVQQTEKTVTVFVEHKLAGEELGTRLALPTTLATAHGTTVGIDVVELGKFERSTGGGSSIGQSDSAGTLGVIAHDINTRRMVALTAQHVVGANAHPGMKLYAPWPQTSNSLLVGQFLRGTMHDTDAAAISIADPDMMIDYIPEIGRVNGWRPIVSSDVRQPVWMYGATSGFQMGQIHAIQAQFPRLDLADALVVRIRARGGDSGAAILDRNNLVLGLLVGGDPESDLRIFTPIGLVLGRLHCQLTTH
jgi:hypothetical protein